MSRGTAIAALVIAWLGTAIVFRAAEPGMRASTPEVKKEIVAVIEKQLTAFRKHEVEKAYGYASAELRAQKPIRTFTAIVKSNYPEIWTNTGAEFGIVHDDGARANVTVQVYSKEGDAAYDFTLVKERAGWRIFGVVRHAPKKGGKV